MTMTREEVKAKMAERRAKDRKAIADSVRRMRAGRHADGAVLLRDRERPGITKAVTKRIGGGWRATRFICGEPVGHEEFDRFGDALLALSGKFGSWGPPYGHHGQWIVLGESERF